jgi:coenzyme F420-0:L-glutamate ligase/coenzyme F420-1:gamma-L-glutamate ligase
MLTIQPLKAIGEVRPGNDLAALLADALRKAPAALVAFDLLVVTQKIVSKAEGRFVDLGKVVPGAEARRVAEVTRKDPRLVELVLAESSEVVRAAPHVLITRHRSGHVMANAGIDQSNTGSTGVDQVLLLPEDADASAERLRTALSQIWPEAFGVVISDSFGRPWRYGVTNVAIGASGMPALIDRRGMRDRDGRVLEVTQIALGDMAASAAGLATGEGSEGIPAALIRGLRWDVEARPAAALLRPVAEDLFR